LDPKFATKNLVHGFVPRFLNAPSIERMNHSKKALTFNFLAAQSRDVAPATVDAQVISRKIRLENPNRKLFP
jgi:hypothetical protein